MARLPFAPLRTRLRAVRTPFVAAALAATLVPAAHAQFVPVTPPEQRGRIDAERSGLHDANRLRTVFYNYGMVGTFFDNPDLSVSHTVEVPKGSGLNYSDGVTPFVLARVRQRNGRDAYIMLTGYRERQGSSPITNRVMRFEPRPGFLQADPEVNRGRSIALSNDPRTWPACWPDKATDATDPGWCGSWNGFFGKTPNADQESFFVMDDNLYDAWDFYPDSRDETRRGLGLRVEVRGFQWSNPQAQNVIFWHYDIVNDSTTTYEDIVFGLYMDSGVGGSQRSCDGVSESDDDNAFFNRNFGLNLVYTWDKNGRGVGLGSNCVPTGYLGYAYLETPGNPFNGLDDDGDGIRDERRDNAPGERIVGQDAIRAAVQSRYTLADFERVYGPLAERPAYVAGIWFTGDEDMDWVAEFHDTGVDGVPGTRDTGEGDGQPGAGEPNVDQTDINESDQIGLTGFKMNRIAAGVGAPSSETDNIVFFTNEKEWPQRLYQQFTAPTVAERFDQPLVLNYNIGFLFSSGPFKLEAARRERFSLSLAYGQNLTDLQSNVEVVQSIYNANYRFATPPPLPTLRAEAGDRRVTLYWDNAAERSVDPVTNRNDFEGYRVYRSTDPNFLDAQVITDAQGGPIGNGKPIAQYDLVNDVKGYSTITVNGAAYYLGNDTGIRHSFVDTTVVNGQTYYYAVTSYDRGSDEFKFYPSENAITISRTARGGTILPINTAEVRPNARVGGYVGATIDPATIVQRAGSGTGSVDVRVLSSALVPDGHRFRIAFQGPADSVRAASYSLFDVTADSLVFEGALDLDGEGTGPGGSGLLPIVSTGRVVTVDSAATGFTDVSLTDAVVAVRYATAVPPGVRRPGYPDNLTVTFSNVPVDTSLAAIGAPAGPVRFRITGDASGRVFDFRFRDVNGDRTLSAPGEYIEVLAPQRIGSTVQVPLWRIDYAGTTAAARAPTLGDVFRLRLNVPYGPSDVIEFVTTGARLDAEAARAAFAEREPFVVPNPYIASAAFEPERFAVSGRGERRLEFRSIPQGATVRIYTLAGDLVATLAHDGSTTDMVPWDLRSKDNLEVAPGLYLFHVDAGDAGTFVGKFAIIK